VPDAEHNEDAHGWVTRVTRQVMPLLERGGPVFSLLLLLVGSIIIYYVVSEWRVQQQTTRELVERLLKCSEALGRCAHLP
jgi:hypothetical protein